MCILFYVEVVTRFFWFKSIHQLRDNIVNIFLEWGDPEYSFTLIGELNTIGMKCLTMEIVFICKERIDFCISIDTITDHWMSDREHMETNLMGTTREEIHLNERCKITKISEYLIPCLCKLWIEGIIDRMFFAIVRITSHIRFDISFCLPYSSSHDCNIRFFDGSIINLALHIGHKSVVLCNDENT